MLYEVITYQILSQGTAKAAARYGGKEFACVLGQEMAGYATGETFFVSQALGLRHSHLDSSGYSYDQKPKGKTVEDAVKFLVNDDVITSYSIHYKKLYELLRE